MGMLWLYRTAEDLLKWYNTFTAHPEVIGLSKEALNNLTTPLQPIGVPSINASFAQGIAATGNKNLTDKVRSLTHPGTHFWGCHELHDCILNPDVSSSCQASASCSSSGHFTTLELMPALPRVLLQLESTTSQTRCPFSLTE